MEKAGTAGSKKTQDDPAFVDQNIPSGDGGEAKKEPPAEKLEKEECVKNEGNAGNQKKDRNASSVTPRAPSRSTRSSNNPEFVAKQRHFLQKVNQGVFYQSSEEESDYGVTNGQSHAGKRKRSVSGGIGHSEVGAVTKSTSNVDPVVGSNSSQTPSPLNVTGSKVSSGVKRRKHEVDELSRDIYCWVCHREMGTSSGGSTLSCEVCPRVYHARCCHSMDPGSPYPSSPSSSSNNNIPPLPLKKGWACPECVKIVRAETMGTRSRAMQLISMDQLCALLKFVLTRVRAVTGAEPFYGAVDLQQFPRYREFVASPMDLGLIDRNIRRRTYGSTEAFFADMKWLVHNSIIFNTQHSKLTSIARSMLKICRQELMEIENCPDCYSNAHTRKDNWFIDVCRRPHILVWAKLKGFPHWPAKAMRVNKESCVDVRFFGAHDRAWVPARDCFLYSKEMPAPPKNRKKNNFDGCIMEVENHIKKLKEKYGVFVYAPLRTVYEPSQDDEILMQMLPKYQPLNLNTSSSYVRENLQEENLSRESPSVSLGTEEESDRDQSIDEDVKTSQKREYDTTFEDSMEIPSGCDTSQHEGNFPSGTKPAKDADKATPESGMESEGKKESKGEAAERVTEKKTEANAAMGEAEGKQKKIEVEMKGKEDKKDEVEGKEAENEAEAKEERKGAEAVLQKSEKSDSMEDKKEEEGAKVDGEDTGEEKGRKNADSGEMEVTSSEEGKGKLSEDTDKVEELKSKSVPLQDDVGKVSLSPSEGTKDEKEMDAVDTKVFKEKSVSGEDEKVSEGEKEKDKYNKAVSDEAEVDNPSEVAVKDDTDGSRCRTTDDQDSEVNKGEEKDEREKVVGIEERKTVTDSAMKVEGELMEEEKEISNYISSSNEEQGENTESTSKKAENPVDTGTDASEAKLKDVESDEVGDKCTDDRGKSNESPLDTKGEKASLNECGNDDSADDKLDALIDHSIEPEIHNIIRSACSEDESMEALASEGSVKKRKISGSSKSSEKSCEKTESDTMDRDGEESRAKLFQSLRLVNIETLHKHDKEAAARKDNLEVDKSKKDSLVGTVGSKLEMSNKIDVNKLRESLMTKCASSAGTEHESASSKSDLGVPSASSTEEKLPQSGNDDLEKVDANENMEVDSDGAEGDNSADISVEVTSPASNKGDVGSQLRVLGKLQQRLSFIKETASESDESTQEKEDENTAEDADSATGDVSGTSNSDDEDPATHNDHSSETGKESVPEAKTSDKVTDGAADVDAKGLKSTVDDNDASKCMEKEEKKLDKGAEEAKVSRESLSGSENKRDDDSSVREERKDLSDKKDSVEIGKAERCSSESETKQSDAEPEKPSKTDEGVNKEGNRVSRRKSSSTDLSESGRASPMTSKRQRLAEAKDSDSVKARATPPKTKPEEVVEEEVLNREVLKESNMVVVQKTVKTRRVDEDSGGSSAPKRARKGVTPKGVTPKGSVVDRSESPAQDEVFPSMFLDPSVTITVLQEAEKENGGSKEQPSGSSCSEEVRSSVNLSNDVSLTMVRGTGALEGLAAMQDGAVSRSSEQSEVDFLGQSPQNSVSPLAPQFRPRARKSFPRPSPRIYARSPQSPAPSQSPSMEVRRLPNNSRDTSPMNLAAGASVLKTAPNSNFASVPMVAVRGAGPSPPVPLTSVNNFSPTTFSTPSTSQGLVRSVVSQVMPPSSLLVAQSNCQSPRLPTLCPRPNIYPLSGPQPLFTPSEAGPMSAEFNKHAHKLSCYMRQAIEDILGDLAKMGNPDATIKSLRLEVEKLRWEHAQEIAELKHNQDLVISEIKTSWEKEKVRLITDVRRQCEAEKLRAIEETKRKQWCANCSKEALFYCCWNTSYCDYPCQQTHWPRHMASCAQNNGMPESGSGDSNSSGNRKDGASGGHRGAQGPPPPFHQLQRSGNTTQESQPEEEYYDEDSSSPPTPRMSSSGGTYRVKRRRCGVCKGCLVKDNCGNCAPCRNSKTHQVCRMRRCRSLQSDWSSGGTSRTTSPEPGPTSMPIETPPLTLSSKLELSSTPLAIPDHHQPEIGGSSESPVAHEMTTANLSPMSPYGGMVTSKPTTQPLSKGSHQDSALELPQQQMISPGLPPPLIQPNCIELPKSCTGNEQSSVSSNYSPAPTLMIQSKDLQTMQPSNSHQNADLNSESNVSQALVPYHAPSEPQVVEPVIAPVLKPSRSRKGLPQRSRNHCHPTRNTYLQPPHFIHQLSHDNEKPFNNQVPETSPQSQESQLLIPQSFPPMPKGLALQTEKAEVNTSKYSPQSRFPCPQPGNHDVPFMRMPLGSGGIPNFPNMRIVPIPGGGSNPHQISPPHASPCLERSSYYSPSLPHQGYSKQVTPELNQDMAHFQALNSQVRPYSQYQAKPKHIVSTNKRGPVLPDQFCRPSGDKNAGPSNASLYLPNSNAAFLGSVAHSTSVPQNPENPDQFCRPSGDKNAGPSNANLHLPNSNATYLGSVAHSTSVPQNPENPDQFCRPSGDKNAGPSNASLHLPNSNATFLGSVAHSTSVPQNHENPDQFCRPSGDKNAGPSNASLHLPNSNAAFLGSVAHPTSVPQNPENLAALPPNFYPQTAMSLGNTLRSDSQPTQAKPSFLNSHHKSANVKNSPVVCDNYTNRPNSNSHNTIPSRTQNQVEIGGWAVNSPFQAQDSGPQPPISDLTTRKYDNDVPKNYTKMPTSVDQLPNFSAAFLNQGMQQPDITPRPPHLSQVTSQMTPPKNVKHARKGVKKQTERSTGETSKPHLATVHDGPQPTFKVQPENTPSVAHFCTQLNCSQIGGSRVHPSLPTHPVPPSHYQESGYPQPRNLYPMPRYNALMHGDQGSSHRQIPAGSQQNNHPYGPVRGSCMAILSATSIIMPPPPPNPPNFLFPPPFDVEALARHQLHRQQMASGMNIFAETRRNSMDGTCKQ